MCAKSLTASTSGSAKSLTNKIWPNSRTSKSTFWTPATYLPPNLVLKAVVPPKKAPLAKAHGQNILPKRIPAHRTVKLQIPFHDIDPSQLLQTRTPRLLPTTPQSIASLPQKHVLRDRKRYLSHLSQRPSLSGTPQECSYRFCHPQSQSALLSGYELYCGVFSNQ